MKILSLRKSKKILIGVYQLLKRKKKKLLPAQVNEIKNDLKDLQEQILQKNREGADNLAHKCLDYSRGILKKGAFEATRDFIFAFVFALAIALLIRQVWFELYQIPTGSMRPTFKEQDRLIVSKTDFGINFPFTPGHFYFDPELVKRLGTVTFTVDNMDVHDSDTMYFYIIPAKKQFVKRVIGLPGDILYFYGGKIYGVDKGGKDISHELQLSKQSKIVHIPIISFNGKISVSEPFRAAQGSAYRMTIIHQMNEPVARLTNLTDHRFEGEMLFTPLIHYRNSPPVKKYSKLWGLGNYAMTRIVSKDRVRGFFTKNDLNFEGAELYLEMQHNPDLDKIILGKDLYGRIRPKFILDKSIIPLDDEHLKTLFSLMTTARFVVKNGYAMSYSHQRNKMKYTHFLPRLNGVPDGTYEFFEGEASQVLWGGQTKKLAKDHPLYRYSSERAKTLYNFGIHFDSRFVNIDDFDTSRFAYFRDGALYTLNGPLFKKGEKMLQDFIQFEEKRSAEATPASSYQPFIDKGAPVAADGKIDVDLIRKFGVMVPPQMYMVLGDNFANSGDSRAFGFVPQENLRGAPSILFWPFSSRMGAPNQPAYPWFTFPQIFIWSLALVGCIIWYMIHSRTHKLPLKFD